MQVQSLERTFIDKVFAICDYRLQDMQDRDSRHLYDIAKLLPEIKITPELDALIDDVRDDRMQSKNNPAAQPEHDIPAMLKGIISSRFYESDYNNITKKLLYEDVSYEEAISKGEAMKKLPMPMNLIKIMPDSYDLLDSDLKKDGFGNRQHLDL